MSLDISVSHLIVVGVDIVHVEVCIHVILALSPVGDGECSVVDEVEIRLLGTSLPDFHRSVGEESIASVFNSVGDGANASLVSGISSHRHSDGLLVLRQFTREQECDHGSAFLSGISVIIHFRIGDVDQIVGALFRTCQACVRAQIHSINLVGIELIIEVEIVEVELAGVGAFHVSVSHLLVVFEIVHVEVSHQLEIVVAVVGDCERTILDIIDIRLAAVGFPDLHIRIVISIDFLIIDFVLCGILR